MILIFIASPTRFRISSNSHFLSDSLKQSAATNSISIDPDSFCVTLDSIILEFPLKTGLRRPVLDACEREGSLDSAINQQTLVANDFEAFLKTYPAIQRIYFNGKTVEQLFERHVIKKQTVSVDIAKVALPSTSPANARLSFESKLKAWAVVVDGK